MIEQLTGTGHVWQRGIGGIKCALCGHEVNDAESVKPDFKVQACTADGAPQVHKWNPAEYSAPAEPPVEATTRMVIPRDMQKPGPGVPNMESEEDGFFKMAFVAFAANMMAHQPNRALDDVLSTSRKAAMLSWSHLQIFRAERALEKAKEKLNES